MTLSRPLLALAALSPLASAQCDITGLDNPFSQGTYAAMEWQGHYYDGGWFHLRRRAVGGGSWADFGGGISGSAGSMFVDDMVEFDGMIVFGGSFFTAGGMSVNNIVAWDGSTFVPLGSGFNSEVNSVTVWDGKLIAGGEFTLRGDGAMALEHVAMFDPEAGDWEPLGDGLGNLPAGYSSAIWGLTVHQGDLYATGRFRSSGATAVNGVARWDSGSNSWQPLGTGIPGMANGNTGTAIASYDGELWVSGWFQSIGGVSSPFMGVWNGTNWTAAPNGSTRHCLSMCEFQGDLIASGPFPFTLGSVEYDVARYDGNSWQPVGNTDVNWPSDTRPNAAGDGLLIGGTIAGFEGVFTGTPFLYDCGGGAAGMNYCTAVPNSTGVPATMSSTGSNSVAQNNLVLECSAMPLGVFSYFLNSQVQGNTSMPGGSQGTLCLAGAIGRHNRPGEVMNTGGTGSVALALDLNDIPTPFGPVAVLSGETYNFTCWYRDMNPTSTSNFADGYQVMFQ